MAATTSLAPSTFDGSTFFDDGEDVRITAATVEGIDGNGSFSLAGGLASVLLPGQGVVQPPATANKKPGAVVATVTVRKITGGNPVTTTLTIAADANGPMIGTAHVTVAKRPGTNQYRVRIVGQHVAFDANGRPFFDGIRTEPSDITVA